LTVSAGGSPDAVDALREWGRRERISSDWIVIDQARIDMFASATGDGYWLHTDPARAERESPYRSTIAHGFLLLSLTVGDDVDRITAMPCVAHVLNYGLDKVRFLMPVLCGARVRVRSRLESLAERQPGCWLLRQSKIMDIQGKATAALVAEHLALVTLA
jgi:acyl dehydratase